MIQTAGILTLVGVFGFAFLVCAIGAYCHFCCDADSGGRFYRSEENIASIVYHPHKSGKQDDGCEEECECHKQFKGSCKYCESTKGFVNDGDAGQTTDFSDFGGNRENDPGVFNSTDPVRGFLGDDGDGV